MQQLFHSLTIFLVIKILLVANYSIADLDFKSWHPLIENWTDKEKWLAVSEQENSSTERARQIRPDEITGLARGSIQITRFYADDKRHLFADINHSNQRSIGTISIPNCSEFYRKVRAQDKAIETGSKDFPINLSFGLITNADKPVLDLAYTYCEMSRDGPSDVKHTYKILSIVGPLVTIEVKWSAAISGGPPYNGEHWLAIDLRTGKSAKLGDFLDTDSLISELRKDSAVMGFFGGTVPTDTSLEMILANFQTTESAFSIYDSKKNSVGITSGFAFYKYDKQRNRVAVRLSFYQTPPGGMAPAEISQIGIWVKPKTGMEKYFLEASEGKGFYISSKFDRRHL